MLIALHVKKRTNFVLKDQTIPNESDIDEYENWLQNDNLVFSWLINSMSKELGDTFLFAPTARDLWKELEHRYGEHDGHLYFHLRKELNTISQAQMTITAFFNKLKRLWDEIAVLKPVTNCTCGEARLIVQSLCEEDKLMQFLCGLNVDYEHVRNQILLMDPLPTVNKACSMLFRIEKQKEVTPAEVSDFAHFSNSGSKANHSGSSSKNITTSKATKDGTTRYCDICKTNRHDKSSCFRIHGYPEWWKGTKRSVSAGSGAGSSSKALLIQGTHCTPLDNSESDDDAETTTQLTQDMQKIVQAEIQKYLKDKKRSSSTHKSGDFSAFASLSGHNN
ncbi:uncharacterized protein [Euphorbia lathyris]|uniref:uncharacterized protein n=1 Tax=Euphorbia lathyris TaxID=212925 RepID=UPI003313A689